MSCAAELVTGPLNVYWAPTGEVFPDIDTAPAGNWLAIGSHATPSRRYGEDGISILQDVETSDVRSLGSIHPECVLVTAANLRVTLMLKDLSLAQLRAAFNFNTVSAVAGPPAHNSMSLDVGTNLTVVSILVRGDTKSPDELTFPLQFEFENCIEIATKDLNFNKEDAAGAALEFRILAGDMIIRAGTS